METCEVTKHSAVGYKSQKMFLLIGENNISSIINSGDVGITKRIHLLESLASDFKNTIFKITGNKLGKGQNKSSVATILNAANISDASQIS